MCNVLEGCPCNETPPAKKPSWDDVEVGDTVVYERRTTVAAIRDGHRQFEFKNRFGFGHIRSNDSEVTLKSIEKPVVTFKPGDVVRSKFTDEVVTIGEGRCFIHSSGRWDAHPGIEHNSASYELVED